MKVAKQSGSVLSVEKGSKKQPTKKRFCQCHLSLRENKKDMNGGVGVKNPKGKKKTAKCTVL